MIGDEIRNVASKMVPLAPASDTHPVVLALLTVNRGTYGTIRMLWR